MKLPQFNFGPFVGGLRFHASSAMSYMAIFTVFFSSSAAYEQLRIWFPWMNYWMVVGAMAVIFFSVMAMEHVFIYRAMVTYMSRQAFGDYNPTVKLLKQIDKKLDDIQEEIDVLKLAK